MLKKVKYYLLPKKQQNNNIILLAGDKGLYSENNNTIIKESAPTSNAMAWVSQKLVFENTPLIQVKADIENYFGITITVSKELEYCLFSGEFAKPQADNVLQVISLSVGCKIRKADNTVFLEGEGCKN